jgi:peptidoglycan/LPS O-acetylase OafA/YrhL
MVSVFKNSSSNCHSHIQHYYTTLLNDYFSISGKSTPLLHIWSLSLEEQFYLIWPLLLLGIIQSSRNFKIFSLFFITILSLITSHLQFKVIQLLPTICFLLEYLSLQSVLL